MGDSGEVKGIRLRTVGNAARSGIEYWKITLLPASEKGTSQGSLHPASICNTTWQQGEECECVTARWCEVTVDVQNHVRGIAGIDAYRRTDTPLHDRSVGLHSAIRRIHGRSAGLRLTGGPHCKVSKPPAWHHRNI